MSGISILKPNQIDVSKITYSEPQLNNYNGKKCRVKYDRNDFLIQTPRMSLPYGLSVWRDKDPKDPKVEIGDPKYSVDLSFKGYKESEDTKVNEKIKEFYDLVDGMRESAIKACVDSLDSSTPWMKKDPKKDKQTLCDSLYRDCVKYSDGDKYPPTLKAKMGVYEGRFAFDTYNDKKEKITRMEDVIEHLKVKRVEVICLIKPEITFSGQSYGFSFRVYQVVVFPSERRSGLQIDLSGETTSESTGETVSRAPPKPSHEVADSDGEEETHEETPDTTHEEDERVNDDEELKDDLDGDAEEPPPPSTKKTVIGKGKGKGKGGE